MTTEPHYSIILRRYPFRPLRRLFSLMVGFGAGFLVVFFMAMWLTWGGMGWEFADPENPPDPFFYSMILSSILLANLFGFVAYFSYALWLWRAAENLKVFRDKVDNFPVWVILCCVIPPLHLVVMPWYFFVLYRNSLPSDRPVPTSYPLFLLLRFLLMLGIVMALIGGGALMMVLQFRNWNGDIPPPQPMQLAPGLFQLYVVSVVTLAWAFVSIVRRITEMQESKFNRRPVSCPHCGESLAQLEKQCPLCGEELNAAESE